MSEQSSYEKMIADKAARLRERRTYLYVLIGEAIEHESFIHLEGDELSLCVGEDGLVDKPYSLRQKLAEQLDACDDVECIDRLKETRDTLREALARYDEQIQRFAEAWLESEPTNEKGPPG